MTYVIISSDGLSGARPLSGVRPPRLLAPTLGAAPVAVCADGTTPGQREVALAQIAVVVADWERKLQGIIDGQLSLTSVFSRGLLFTKSAADARASLIRAKKQLSQDFMPIVSNAMRDYNRNINEIQSSVTGYFQQLEGQVGAALKTEEAGRFTAIFESAKKAGRDIVTNTLKEGAGIVNDVVDEGLPWWVLPLAGLAIIGYATRAFR